MKKTINKIVALALCLVSAFTLTACGGSAEKGLEIAVPNDPTNEARALLLLEDLGYLTLNPEAGVLATVADITENPHNISFKEVEAAQIPNILKDVDFGIINSNYAIPAGINPAEDALQMEGSTSAYVNLVCVKEGNENSPEAKALAAAVNSKTVADYITKTYGGSVVSAVDNPGDGYDATVDYAALKGTKITVAASPAPHSEILALAKEILAAKGVELEIKEFTDYIQPNLVVDSGEVFANFFQHAPYMDNFNKENNTHIVSIAGVHVEPMGIYGGKQTSLDAITAE